MISGFKQVWDKLYSPDCAYPDVSLDDVICTMVEIASKYKKGDKPDKWILTYIAIYGPLSISDLKMSWSGVTVNGAINLDKYDAACIIANKEIEEAVARLVKSGKIKKKENKLFRNDK